MTCIVGWIENGVVTIGGDAAAVSGLRVTQRVAPKVFINGPMVFGFTSSFRMGDLLQHAFTVPEQRGSESVDKYMRTTFIDAVRSCLKTGGFARKENEVERGGTFLVGYEGRLFYIDSDYQVGESTDGFDAVGCGDEFARGAMAILRAGPSVDVEAKLRRALEVAAKYSGGVSPPFAFVQGGARSNSGVPAPRD
ncbi:MAG: hypothetical protein JWN27_2908 [Candidatus Eremiobacteraeota bacterium]|nr:hypothetical protein [Candidatus Eremiobacteraeota bacterium]